MAHGTIQYQFYKPSTDVIDRLVCKPIVYNPSDWSVILNYKANKMSSKIRRGS